MNAATVLAVPAPTLQFDPAGSSAQIEKPVNLRLAPLVHADGQPATKAQLLKVAAFVFRSASAGGGEELWNEAAQAWQPSTTDLAALDALTPLALAFKEGDAQPWQGVLVASGQKDGTGAPRYATATNGFPAYRVRVLARFKRGALVDTGLSPPSADLRFVSATDRQRFAIVFDTGSVNDCSVARLQLRNADRVATGFLELRASGPALEIGTCDAGGATFASVVITGDGDIELRPAAGRRVIVRGDLEADHVRYLPVGGTLKKDLA